MISVLLLLFVAGIALSQALSDPRAVTLRWLRLGGLIAVTFWALAVVVRAITAEQTTASHWVGLAIVAVPTVAQLMLTQIGKRTGQRLAAWATFLLASVVATHLTGRDALTADALLTCLTFAISGGILGGLLMTMLLGHAYLTSGNEMTQAPFERLVRALVVLLVLRLIGSAAFALYPWYAAIDYPRPRLWTVMMITARYLVGLAVPILFTVMSWECVRRRANQSATGILYVASVLVIIGEGIALNLTSEIGTGL